MYYKPSPHLIKIGPLVLEKIVFYFHIFEKVKFNFSKNNFQKNEGNTIVNIIVMLEWLSIPIR